MNPKLLPAAIFIFLTAGCASAKQPKSVSEVAPAAATDVPAASSASRRVTLPYTFSRHGVAVSVNSIEFADAAIVVNVTLEEKRGEAADLSASTLLQVFTPDGHALAYLNSKRADKVQTDPTLHVAAREQYPVNLSYQLPPAPPDAPANPIELRFPTGKYWSSETAD